MIVGVPKETKDHEHRVGIIRATAELVRRGHRVLVERGAGVGAGLTDAAYEGAGAEILDSADQVFERAELIVKVKEPLAHERKRLKRGQVLFTYLHLAADPSQAEALIASGLTAIAYETVTGPRAARPPSHADVGGCGPHGAASWCVLSGESDGWARRAEAAVFC